MKKRELFDAVFAVYVAVLLAPVVGELAGIEAYVGFVAGVWFMVYTVMRAKAESFGALPARVGRRPTATVLIILPLVYGVAYVVGALVAEPPVRSPYVYLGILNVVLAVFTVAVARDAGRVGSYRRRR